MSRPASPLSRAALVVALYVGLGGVGVVWAAFRGHTAIWRYEEHPGEPMVWTGLAVGLLLGLMIVFASRWAVHHFEWARAFHMELKTLLGPMRGAEIFTLAAASSVGEEIFFRGALLPVIGLWPSSLIFAALHIPPKKRFWPWTASSFVAGLLLGQVFVSTGHIGGAIVGHFVVNFLNLRHLRDHALP